uniref:Protein kinase domain-containing protein n=1 Tax=Chenopodium quinoa TaxID=63459 RepID=A0A803LLR7_CHEQI
MSDFNTHFTFIVDTLGQKNVTKHGHGFTFFIAPVGFEIPPNSAAAYLGLFNTTTRDLSTNQLIVVEFDSYGNGGFEPYYQHVGINVNSVSSSVNKPWNGSEHSGDSADVWVIYNATTEILSVFWSYKDDPNFGRNVSMSLPINVMKIIPEWVNIGFSAATGESSFNDELERGTGPRRFSYFELKSATHNFSSKRKLGEGGFGCVYKGYLVDFDMPIAVKKISRGSRQGKKEYVAEVKIISKLRHRTGRQLKDPIGEGTNMVGLIQWVWDLYGNGGLLSATDQRLKMEFDAKQFECLMLVGLWCVHPDYNYRPSIKQAIQVLNFEAAFPSLPSTMPVPIYHVPVMTPIPPSDGSIGPSMISTSLEIGR